MGGYPWPDRDKARGVASSPTVIFSRAQAESGLSVQDYCFAYGLNVHTFHHCRAISLCFATPGRPEGSARSTQA